MSVEIQAQTRSLLDQLSARQAWRLRHILVIALIIAFLAWCADGVNLRPREVTNALPVIADYFARMWPPKWGFVDAIWKPAIETVYVALWGNVLATIVGIPLGLLAASTVTIVRMRSGSCFPRTANLGGRPEMLLPWVAKSVSPRAAVSIPRVTTNGGTRPHVTTRPFNFA